MLPAFAFCVSGTGRAAQRVWKAVLRLEDGTPWRARPGAEASQRRRETPD
ncbi:MAG: hypothetical protein PQJ50_01220 [Spirochaetales bacterium]|nr:hypothetical protein [Spirochaetales bacterium]